MFKKNIKILFISSLLSLWSFGSQAEDWIMASGYAKSNFHTQNIIKFIDEVKSTTSVNINLNPNDTLIKIDAIKSSLQRGQIPIGEIRLGIYGNEDPMYVLAGMPFIAPDYASGWLLKDIQMDYLQKRFAKKGLMILYTTPWPGQGFYTKFPVNQVSDFKGKKLRIYSTATQEMGSMLGFNATILPFAEIPQAFSTGLIEALFTSPQTGIDIQAWDNTKHFTYAGAIFSKNAVVVTKKAFNALSKKDQGNLLVAAKNAELRGWEMSSETTKAQIATLEKNGMLAKNAPDAVISKMKSIGQEMIKTWRKKAIPESNAFLYRYLAIR